MSFATNHITRLSKYKAIVKDLQSVGLNKILAQNIADAAGIKASQVRKDFSLFGIIGHKKGGYDVEELLQQLEKLIGVDKTQDIVILGYGRVGSAIADFPEFQSDKIRIIAAFDKSPVQGAPIPVYPVDELETFLKKHSVRAAILAVPDSEAQPLVNRLVKCGITGVLNFTSRHLSAPMSVYVNNIDVTMALETVIFHTTNLERDLS